MRVNLHTHSTVSDGTLSPCDLAAKLHGDGVEVFALTDHDKIDGLSEAKFAAERFGMRFITGVEISASTRDIDIDFLDPTTHSIHLLGLGFDGDALARYYYEKDDKKRQKLHTLNKKLIKLGYKIPLINDLRKRTQVANYLVERGYSTSLYDAFENIINHYYDRWEDSMNIKEAVAIIHQSKGRLLWAHPYEVLKGLEKVCLTDIQIDLVCARLKSLGIDGIEVYYGMYDDSQIRHLSAMQHKYDFIASAGTDYHGKANRPATFVDIDIDKIKGVLE